MRYGCDDYVATVCVQHIACTAYNIAEPQSMKEALDSDVSAAWKNAADSEYLSLLN